MTSTTHPEFNGQTEALDVAAAFPNLVRDKTILVTGVNPKGIGYTTAEAFASQSPAHLILAGRTLSKLEESLSLLKEKYPNVNYRILQLNLGSQKDVRASARELLAWQDVPTVDIIVNSAGISFLPEKTISEDGVELTFATNHIGHFLFTNLIMPKVIKAAEKNPKGQTRIINVSSMSPTFGCMRWSDIKFDKINKTLPESEQPLYEVQKRWGAKNPENASYLPLEAYNQSKVANVLFSIGANRRLYEKHGILSLVLHPGVIHTELARSAPDEIWGAIESFASGSKNFWRSAGAGSATTLVASLDPKLSVPEDKDGEENWGVYLIDCQISDKARPLVKSSSEADRLWQLSEKLVGEEFSW